MTTAAPSDNYLYTMARRASVPPDDCEDAVQEMRLGMWRARPDVNPVMVAKRRLNDYLRARNHWRPAYKTQTVLLIFEIRDADAHEQIMGELPGPDFPIDMVLMINEALAKLPRYYRAPILLSAYGYSGPEIAAIMGLKLGSVNQYLYHGRKRLRELMAA